MAYNGPYQAYNGSPSAGPSSNQNQGALAQPIASVNAINGQQHIANGWL